LAPPDEYDGTTSAAGGDVGCRYHYCSKLLDSQREAAKDRRTLGKLQHPPSASVIVWQQVSSRPQTHWQPGHTVPVTWSCPLRCGSLVARQPRSSSSSIENITVVTQAGDIVYTHTVPYMENCHTQVSTNVLHSVHTLPGASGRFRKWGYKFVRTLYNLVS